jgi:hypothetical protein
LTTANRRGGGPYGESTIVIDVERGAGIGGDEEEEDGEEEMENKGRSHHDCHCCSVKPEMK